VQRAADRPPVSKRSAQAASHDSVDAAVRLGNEPARWVRREMEELDDLGRRERILRHARNATTPAGVVAVPPVRPELAGVPTNQQLANTAKRFDPCPPVRQRTRG